MNHQLGDAAIQEKYAPMMRAMAEALDEALNGNLTGKDRKNGFVLMVFPFDQLAGGDARCNYISNGADRNDVVALMKEMIARFEGQPQLGGHA